MSTPDLIGSREACQILQIDKSTLSRWVAGETLMPAMRLSTTDNGAFLFRRKDVERLAAERAS